MNGILSDTFQIKLFGFWLWISLPSQTDDAKMLKLLGLSAENCVHTQMMYFFSFFTIKMPLPVDSAGLTMRMLSIIFVKFHMTNHM